MDTQKIRKIFNTGPMGYFEWKDQFGREIGAAVHTKIMKRKLPSWWYDLLLAFPPWRQQIQTAYNLDDVPDDEVEYHLNNMVESDFTIQICWIWVEELWKKISIKGLPVGLATFFFSEIRNKKHNFGWTWKETVKNYIPVMIMHLVTYQMPYFGGLLVHLGYNWVVTMTSINGKYTEDD